MVLYSRLPRCGACCGSPMSSVSEPARSAERSAAKRMDAQLPSLLEHMAAFIAESKALENDSKRRTMQSPLMPPKHAAQSAPLDSSGHVCVASSEPGRDATLLAGHEQDACGRDAPARSSSSLSRSLSSLTLDPAWVAQTISAMTRASKASLPEKFCTHSAAPMGDDAGSLSNFGGCWKLASTVGDIDAVFTDLGANWVFRKFAEYLNYGVGRVSLAVEQSDDKFKVWKILADPTKQTAFMEFSVGDCVDDWTDDFGPCRLHTSWEGSSLIWDVELKPSGCKLIKKMYLVSANELIEEFASPCGETVRYFFCRA
eukprot:TRINITY_DN4188_c5_g1_i1.p1 TRINITY_DN4188_c5_g1~~TRINITY_DN4188_c5_g1_i1.p1  ORF type:complete len:329 (+),score=36.76 TRINITY_DN4188_c5_g1_i1:47-988(+)